MEENFKGEMKIGDEGGEQWKTLNEIYNVAVNVRQDLLFKYKLAKVCRVCIHQVIRACYRRDKQLHTYQITSIIMI